MPTPLPPAPSFEPTAVTQENRAGSPASGDERPPGLQWKDWRVVLRTNVGGVDYVVLVRHDRSPRTSVRLLTQREHDVLRHASSLISNKEIARRMGISPSTVSVLLGRASRKLGAIDRDDLLGKYAEQSADPSATPVPD